MQQMQIQHKIILFLTFSSGNNRASLQPDWVSIGQFRGKIEINPLITANYHWRIRYLPLPKVGFY